MADIKPIQTIYNGYKFRSRLEARWAVFFDTLGVKYEYEREGYALESGWYLPDFWLPTQSRHIEIKPGEPGEWPEDSRWDEMWEKEENLIVIVGSPFYKIGDFGCPEYQYEGFVCGDNGRLWCECPVCGYVDLEFDGRSDRLGCSCPKYGDKGYNTDTPILLHAYNEAKQARFEHDQRETGWRP